MKIYFLLLLEISVSLISLSEVATSENISTDDQCTPLRTGVTDVDKRLVLDAHNSWRADVAKGLAVRNSSVADMLELEWDENLAKRAQESANTCFSNLNGTVNDRENCTSQLMFVNKVKANHCDANFTMFAEFLFSSTSNNSSDLLDLKKNNSQVYWAKTSKVGCGFMCKQSRNARRHFYVCYYDVCGTNPDDKIYQEGSACSKCPTNYKCSINYPGLCGPPSEVVDAKLKRVLPPLSQTQKAKEITAAKKKKKNTKTVNQNLNKINVPSVNSTAFTAGDNGTTLELATGLTTEGQNSLTSKSGDIQVDLVLPTDDDDSSSNETADFISKKTPSRNITTSRITTGNRLQTSSQITTLRTSEKPRTTNVPSSRITISTAQNNKSRVFIAELAMPIDDNSSSLETTDINSIKNKNKTAKFIAKNTGSGEIRRTVQGKEDTILTERSTISMLGSMIKTLPSLKNNINGDSPEATQTVRNVRKFKQGIALPDSGSETSPAVRKALPDNSTATPTIRKVLKFKQGIALPDNSPAATPIVRNVLKFKQGIALPDNSPAATPTIRNVLRFKQGIALPDSSSATSPAVRTIRKFKQGIASPNERTEGTGEAKAFGKPKSSKKSPKNMPTVLDPFQYILSVEKSTQENIERLKKLKENNVEKSEPINDLLRINKETLKRLNGILNKASKSKRKQQSEEAMENDILKRLDEILNKASKSKRKQQSEDAMENDITEDLTSEGNKNEKSESWRENKARLTKILKQEKEEPSEDNVVDLEKSSFQEINEENSEDDESEEKYKSNNDAENENEDQFSDESEDQEETSDVEGDDKISEYKITKIHVNRKNKKKEIKMIKKNKSRPKSKNPKITYTVKEIDYENSNEYSPEETEKNKKHKQRSLKKKRKPKETDGLLSRSQDSDNEVGESLSSNEDNEKYLGIDQPLDDESKGENPDSDSGISGSDISPRSGKEDNTDFYGPKVDLLSRSGDIMEDINSANGLQTKYQPVTLLQFKTNPKMQSIEGYALEGMEITIPYGMELSIPQPNGHNSKRKRKHKKKKKTPEGVQMQSVSLLRFVPKPKMQSIEGYALEGMEITVPKNMEIISIGTDPPKNLKHKTLNTNHNNK